MRLLTEAVQVINIFHKIKILGNLLRNDVRSLLTLPTELIAQGTNKALLLLNTYYVLR